MKYIINIIINEQILIIMDGKGLIKIKIKVGVWERSQYRGCITNLDGH